MRRILDFSDTGLNAEKWLKEVAEPAIREGKLALSNTLTHGLFIPKDMVEYDSYNMFYRLQGATVICHYNDGEDNA